MNYQNLMDAYLAEGKNIIGRTVKDGNIEKKVIGLRGNNLDLKAVLEDKQIRYSRFQHYECM